MTMSLLSLPNELLSYIFLFIPQADGPLTGAPTLLVCRTLYHPAKEGFYSGLSIFGYRHIHAAVRILKRNKNLSDCVTFLYVNFNDECTDDGNCRMAPLPRVYRSVLIPVLLNCRRLCVQPLDHKLKSFGSGFPMSETMLWFKIAHPCEFYHFAI